MRLETRVARRYAKALADSLDDARLESVREELKTVSSLFDDRAIRYFKSPVVPLEKKSALAREIFSKVKLSDELKKVLTLMAEKDRIGIIKDFESEFENLVDERLGRMKAEIICSDTVADSTIKLIKSEIEKLFGSEIDVKVSIDPDIIGGFVVKVGDKVIDASIKTQLENLKKQLLVE